MFSRPDTTEFEHLPLPEGERREPVLDRGGLRLRQPRFRIACDRLRYRRKQDLRLHGLGEEIDRAALHRAHAGGDIALPGQEDHRQAYAGLRQPVLHRVPVAAGHPQIEHETARLVGIERCEECFCVEVRLGPVPFRREKPSERGQDRRIIVHEVNGRAIPCLGHTGNGAETTSALQSAAEISREPWAPSAVSTTGNRDPDVFSAIASAPFEDQIVIFFRNCPVSRETIS